jgi:predicted HNH restriction endonuclease
VHHIKFRSVGGEDTAENLAALCRVCHAEIHAYRLVISGDANGKLKIERTA